MSADRKVTRTCCEYGEQCKTCQSQDGLDRRVPCEHGADSGGGGGGGAAPAVAAAHRVGARRTPQRAALLNCAPFLLTRESALALLLVSSLLRPALSVPVRRKQHWRNPCALDSSVLADAGTHVTTSSDRMILNRIINLNEVVRPNLDTLVEQFVRSKYHTSQSNMTRDWGHHSISGLAFVSATIDRQTAQLASRGGQLRLDAALLQHFADLQRLAIGLERIALDAALHGDHSLDSFRHLQFDLMTLLCELHLSLLEKRLVPESDGVPQVLDEQQLSSRERDLRNWLILSHYKRYVSHLDQVLRHLRRLEPDG